MNKNNIDRVTVNNGGHVADHSRGEDPIVKTPPQKTTGDIPAEKIVGLAKASPNFKPVEVVKEKPKTKAEEKQIIAESKEEPEQENDEDETN